MLSEQSEKQRLWVVTSSFEPEAVSTGQYLTQTAEGLADEFDVKVICGQPNHISSATQAPNRETRNNVEIFRVWSTRFERDAVVKRVVNMFTLGVSMFWNTLRKFRRGDRVLVVTAPPHLPFTTAIASLIKGGSYTLLIQNLYPDHLVARGKLKQDSIIFKAMLFANAWLFKHAARIIVVGGDMAELVSAHTEGLGVPIKTIPSWVDKGERPETGRNARTNSENKYSPDVALERYREALR